MQMRTITIKAITNARVYGQNPGARSEKMMRAVCVVERSPERITSVAMRVRRIYTGSKAHIQTRPVTSSKRERGSAAKPIFISYSYLPLERREQGLLHIHAPQMWIKWWWGCNNILGRSLEPVYGIDRPGAHTHKYFHETWRPLSRASTPNFNASCFGSRTPSSPHPRTPRRPKIINYFLMNNGPAPSKINQIWMKYPFRVMRLCEAAGCIWVSGAHVVFQFA